MNIITIDPSLNCTAVIVNDKKFIYARDDYVYGKKGKMSKWFELCQPFIEYKIIDYPSYKDHSTNELSKLLKYDQVTTNIINDVKHYSNKNEDYIIGIEGYSYSSQAGPLIDLVTISTLLRIKLNNQISTNIHIYQPSTLKKEACKLTYEPIQVGKKVIKYEYRNHEGIAGGSFKKHEMFKCLIENDHLQCEWVNFIREVADDCLSQKNIPKPIEDMNDAKLFYEVLKKSLTS